METPKDTPNATTSDTRPRKRVGREKLTPECIANIWKPGQCGNPNGRPRTFGDAYRDILNAQHVELHVTDNKGRKHVTVLQGEPDIRQAIAVRVAHEAMRGDVHAAEALADRTDGKVPNTLKLTATHTLSTLSDEALTQHETKLEGILHQSDQEEQCQPQPLTP